MELHSGERQGRRFERTRSVHRSFVSIINNLHLDYALSDRDIRHKFNFFYVHRDVPGALRKLPRAGTTAQPITPGGVAPLPIATRLRKDNEYFSFDWRLQRPFKFGERYALIPIVEMFNTFNNDEQHQPAGDAGAVQLQ